MFEITSGMAAVIISVFFALMGLAYGYGNLNNRVKNNTDNGKDIWNSLNELKRDNKADHMSIQSTVNRILQNGARNQP